MDTHNKYKFCIHNAMPKNKSHFVINPPWWFKGVFGYPIFVQCFVLDVGLVEEPWCSTSVEATALSTIKRTWVDWASIGPWKPATTKSYEYIGKGKHANTWKKEKEKETMLNHYVNSIHKFHKTRHTYLAPCIVIVADSNGVAIVTVVSFHEATIPWDVWRWQLTPTVIFFHTIMIFQSITIFILITIFCGTDNISWNILGYCSHSV